MDNTEILFEINSNLGIITLNRPKALNAINMNMVELMLEKLTLWENDDNVSAVIVRGAGGKAFCAGGDVKSVVLEGRPLEEELEHQEKLLSRDFFKQEYILNKKIQSYPKPYISIIDGIVMGGGKGISAHGSHRVITENTKFAMPETKIGFFPDVGGGYFLNKCPGKIGLYLALTSQVIGAHDAMYIGFGTHYIPSKGIDTVMENFLTADWKRSDPLSVANGILSNYNSEPVMESELLPNQEKIEQHFKFSNVEDIFTSLSKSDDQWAIKTLSDMKKMSPTSLKVTARQLIEAKDMVFAEVITMEYRISQRMVRNNDFFEGVRALLIDKDNMPAWKPASLAEISNADIEEYFEPLGDRDI